MSRRPVGLTIHADMADCTTSIKSRARFSQCLLCAHSSWDQPFSNLLGVTAAALKAEEDFQLPRHEHVEKRNVMAGLGKEFSQCHAVHVSRHDGFPASLLENEGLATGNSDASHTIGAIAEEWGDAPMRAAWNLRPLPYGSLFKIAHANQTGRTRPPEGALNPRPRGGGPIINHTPAANEIGIAAPHVGRSGCGRKRPLD